MRFSTQFDLSEEELEDTIIHEMIHYYICVKGLKVLPRIRQRIEIYRRTMLLDPRIDGITLYLSCDPYFNRFPNSSALNVEHADEQVFLSHLGGAKILDIV